MIRVVPLLVILSGGARAEVPAGELKVCDTYLELQEKLRCPADGYLQRTGYELCRR